MKSLIEKEMTNPDVPSRIGSTGSRLLSGNHSYYETLESNLARFHGGEAALIFNSGYDANIGLFSSVPQPGDLILYDALIHNSVQVGMKASRATVMPFEHNDTAHLRSIIEASSSYRNIIIVVEGVYSMDGDVAPLMEIIRLCDVHAPHAAIIVDEAHATGVLGDHGEGLVGSLGVEDRVFCRVHTFGKALGVHGAVVIGPAELKSYLLNYARSIIYTTSLPTHSLVSIKVAYDVLNSAYGRERRKHLDDLIKYFRKAMSDAAIPLLHLLPSDSPIHGIVLPGNERVMSVTKFLKSRRLNVLPIRPPTVPAGSERLRVAIHAHNTREEIDTLVMALKLAVSPSRL
jgi:8-amino-7-oxononanoate synthase